MHCPNCQTPLQIADQAGIEIDFCTNFRGVWLDKGGLDKVIERSMQVPSRSASARTSFETVDAGKYERRGEPKKKPKKKKREWLEDIFDILD